MYSGAPSVPRLAGLPVGEEKPHRAHAPGAVGSGAGGGHGADDDDADDARVGAGAMGGGDGRVVLVHIRHAVAGRQTIGAVADYRVPVHAVATARRIGARGCGCEAGLGVAAVAPKALRAGAAAATRAM
ncbi:hypothetical protein GCM10010095_21650 [Streptomyces anthocyanicus]|nr:hypothetical protein GCM10010095_21650 [Streptomyces anthocyanicus]